MSEMDKNKNSLLMVIITLLVITIILLVAVIGMMFTRDGGDQAVSGNLPEQSSSQEESSSSEPEESEPEEEESSSSSQASSSSRPVSGGTTAPVSRPSVPAWTPPASSSSQAPAVQSKLTYNTKGTYDDTQTCNSLTIGASGVTVKNKTVKGDLTIQNGVGKSGTVKLENVTVQGKLYVYGGGEIELKDVTASSMTVQRSSDAFHITATGKTKINNTILKAHATLEEKKLADDAEGFMRVTLMESTQIWYEVSIKNAVLTEIAVYSPANISLSSNTKVGTVVAADSVHFTGKGQIGTLKVKADRVSYAVKPKKIENKGYEDPKLGGWPIGTPEPDEGGGGGGGSHRPSNSSSSSSSSSTPTPVKTAVETPKLGEPIVTLDESGAATQYQIPFSVGNKNGITGYELSVSLDGKIVQSRTLPVIGSNHPTSATFLAAEVGSGSNISFQIKAIGNGAANWKDSATAYSPLYQLGLRLTYDSAAKKILVHKGSLAGQQTLQVTGGGASYTVTVPADQEAAVLVDGNGVPASLPSGQDIQITCGGAKSPKYRLPQWEVTGFEPLAAPTGADLVAKINQEGSLASVELTVDTTETRAQGYGIQFADQSGNPIPSITVAPVSGAANRYTVTGLQGNEVISCTIVAKGDGIQYADSAPSAPQTWNFGLKFQHNTTSGSDPIIEAVWPDSLAPTGVSVLSKADGSTPVPQSGPFASPWKLTKDGSALAMGGGTWRLTLTDATTSYVSPWYTIPAGWDVTPSSSDSSSSSQEAPSGEGDPAGEPVE